MNPMENRLPVGPGSRGGQWHDPEYRKAYFRNYRATHPEYRERDNERASRRKRKQARIRQEARVSLSLTMTLREIVRNEPGSLRSLASRLGVDHTVLTRFANDDHLNYKSDLIDALVAEFGIWNIARSWAGIRRDVSARQGNTQSSLGDPSGNASPVSQSRSA